jgi:hypothetical protein
MLVLPAWCRDVALLDAAAPVPLDRPFTADEADAAGVPASLRHKLVERGLLRCVLRGVFVASHVPDSFRLRVSSVGLVVPEHVVVVDRTAAWVHGVDALPRSAIHTMPSLDLFSSSASRVRRAGVRSGVRDLLERDIEEIGPLRITTPLRTACDLGRLLWRYDALGAIDGFLRLGVDHAALVAEVDRFKGHRGVVQLRHLAPLGDVGAESQPESALRLHWHESGIPVPPVTQIWAYADDGTPRYRVDLGSPEVRYGAEYFGEAYHDDDVAEEDQARLDWLVAERSWLMDVFRKGDVYGRELEAGDRLWRGFKAAQASYASRTSTVIDLARREREEVPGHRD